MARKVTKPAPASAPKGADVTGAVDTSEMEILYPERTIPIGGKKVTVNEITFGDGMRLHLHVVPMVSAIEATMLARNEAPAYRDMVAVFAEHWESTLVLIAAATGADESWLKALGGADGDLLLLTFWSVNAGFFIQRAMNELAIRREQERLLAGEKSKQPSSPTATAAPNSGDTPPAS